MLSKTLREEKNETDCDGDVCGVQMKELTRIIKVRVDEKMICRGDCLWMNGANNDFSPSSYQIMFTVSHQDVPPQDVNQINQPGWRLRAPVPSP